MNLRRTLAVLPFFLAALLAQIYAPAGSSLAIGRAEKAELAAPCANHAQQTPASNSAPHAPGAVCDLCDFVFSGAAAVGFDLPSDIGRPADFHRIAWLFPAGRVATPARGGFAQARAPPISG